MAYHYRVKKKIDCTKSGKPVKYYAVPVASKVVGFKKLAKIISDRCSLTGTDVIGCLDALAYVVQREIDDGNNVRLDGIGIFSPSLKSPGFDTPEECTPSTVKIKRLCFLACKDIKIKLREIEFTKIG